MKDMSNASILVSPPLYRATRPLNVLEEQIQHFSLMGNYIIILGDFNGHIANKADFVISDCYKYLPELIPYSLDDESLPKRYSQDKIINDRGKAILDLCMFRCVETCVELYGFLSLSTLLEARFTRPEVQGSVR